ncbi:MAG TPA: apolipoprotein N-acyltransferase, partial [Burkholderiales bacterium]|nr:apolipoprotein N-acyltransferase [Burkholderiales bacterium]
IAGLILLWSEGEDGAWTGFFFGMGLFLFGVSWVYVSLHDFGGMPLPVAVLATVLFCAFLSLYFDLCGKLQEKFKAAPMLKAALFIPSILALADWLRGWLFTGFPWLAFGYSQTDSGPLSGFAPLFGVYGVSLVTATCGGLVYLLSKPASRKKAAILIFMLFLAGYGLKKISWTAPTGKPVTVSLVQGNIPQDRKWSDTALDDTLDAYMRLVLSSKAS